MLDLVFNVSVWFDAAVGVAMLIAGIAGRKPHNLMAVGLGITELLLLIQLVTAIVLVAGGHPGRGDMVEYFIYVAVAFLLPPAAVFWALLDRASKWSTVVMGVAALSVAVMLVRMVQIWVGLALTGA